MRHILQHEAKHPDGEEKAITVKGEQEEINNDYVVVEIINEDEQYADEYELGTEEIVEVANGTEAYKLDEEDENDAFETVVGI